MTLDSRCRAGARPPPSSRSIPTGQWPTRRHTAERSRRRLRHATLDAMHGVAVTPPSTVGEHRDDVIRHHVPANAPGRIEGRCEHHDRAVARGRDTRPDLCLTSEGQRAHDDGDASAHATRAARLAPSRRGQTRYSPRRPPRRRREPRSSRIGPLPSDLPGSSRAPRAEPASNATLDVGGPTRRHVAEPHDDEARSREHATLDVGRGLVPRLRRGPSRPTDARLVGTEPSTVAEGSVTRPSMQCTEWPSRRRARSPSIVTW